MNIILSAQKFFGKEVFKLLIKLELNVVAICVPLDDKYLLPYAVLHNSKIKVIPGGSLTASTMPDNIDLGICAHSFDYVGRKTRYKAKFGWIGYHPSLLPRHRGRSSIEWAIRMNDPITGGSIYWLNSGIDRGDIERQEWIWLDKNKSAKQIWREQLMPMGLKLFAEALTAISKGEFNKLKQDSRFSTFEPSLDRKDIYRPDLLMIEAPKNKP